MARPVEECEGVAGFHTDILSSSRAPKCRVHTCGLRREEEWAHLARIRWIQLPFSSTCSAVKRLDCSMRARSVHLLLPSTSSSLSLSVSQLLSLSLFSIDSFLLLASTSSSTTSSAIIPEAILKEILRHLIVESA